MSLFNKAEVLPWRIAWITGAGRGIGAALVQQLCQRGVTVYASARNVIELEALRDALAGASGRVICAPLDVSRADQVVAMTARWASAGEFPQLVVLNAGTHDPFPAQQFSARRCRDLLAVNLQGSINCLEPVLAHHIQQRGGQVAVMASVAGYRGLPTAAAYGASKAALINLCEALYLELRASGVTLQVINPGFVRTPLTAKNTFPMPALMEPDQAAEQILKGLVSGRFEIVLPRRFVYLLKLLRLLPYRCYFSLIERCTGKGNR